jgi:chondroitin AC lyase
MKKCMVFFHFLLLFNCIASAQMNVLFDQTRAVFIENIEDPIGLTQDVITDLVPLVRTSSPNIGAFDTGLNGTLDFDYEDRDDNNCSIGTTSGWEPKEHLENLARMAEGFALATTETQRTTIANALILGLQYWYSLNETTQPLPACPDRNNYPSGSDCRNIFPNNATVPSTPWCCDNWWWNEIGKQRELSKIGILLYDRLTGPNAPTVPNSGNPGTRLLDALIEDFPDNVEKHSNEPGETEKYTGANLTDVAAFVLMKGILSHDYVNGNNCVNALVSLAITEFEYGALSPASEVACNDYDDGIQADYSFFQHDRILYSSGYGYSFIESFSRWGAALSGNTCFFFDGENQDFLLNAILEGWRWMIRGNTADYSVSGRNITRNKPGNHTSIPDQHMTWLIELAEGVGYNCLPQTHPNYVAPVTPMGKALEEMKLKAQQGLRQNILGNKYFWMADYVAHHEEKFFSSVKMCAREDITINQCDGGTEGINGRTTGTESRNGDNEKGYWLPYGCTFIYQSGTEYDGLFSTSNWDWNKIPGVTSTSGSELKPGKGGDVKNTHNSNFVGSAGNSKYAVTTLELNKDHNYGHMDARKAWFHFGGEIIALGGGIFDNSGKSVYTTMNQSKKNGAISDVQNVPGARWRHHDNIAYIYPAANTPDYGDAVTFEETSTVFRAWFNHGTNPANKRYFYRVVPGIAVGEVNAYITNNPVDIIVNEEADGSYRQAVKKGNLLGVVYYPDGFNANAAANKIEIRPGVQIRTSHPCALLYDGNTGEVCIS